MIFCNEVVNGARYSDMKRKVNDLLARVDTDGLMSSALSELMHGSNRGELQTDANYEFTMDEWARNGRAYCKLARNIINGIEGKDGKSGYMSEYPELKEEIRDFIGHRCVIFTSFFLSDIPEMDMERMSADTYEYMQKMAKVADRYFTFKNDPKGYGVGYYNSGLVHINFAHTQFFCKPEEGVSGMLVKTPSINEKVVLKAKNKDADKEFDYEKAAMLLLLKGAYGSQAVDMISFVEKELRDSVKVSAKKPETTEGAQAPTETTEGAQAPIKTKATTDEFFNDTDEFDAQ